MIYEKTTGAIHVAVEPSFRDEDSEPGLGKFVWSYHVTIENRGTAPVRLRTRYWRITDAHGEVQEVTGEGVVGEQPLLRPGQRFSYTSGTPLGTDSGFMAGTYTMEDASGRPFIVEIPSFSLHNPETNRIIN